MNTTNHHRSRQNRFGITVRWRALLFLVMIVLFAGACGSTDEANTAITAQAEETTAPTATSTTATPTTTSTEAEVTTTAEACVSNCPVDAETMTQIDAIFDAYNSHDWQLFTDTLQDPEPSWTTPLGDASAELVKQDFIWSTALNDRWTVTDCVDADVRIICTVLIEDDLHRALAPLGLEPAECRFFLGPKDDGVMDIRQYEITPCFNGYDIAMHAFGIWYETSYPDEDPIQGFHYRAWNQPDETAGDRAASVLAEYIASGEASLGEPLHD